MTDFIVAALWTVLELILLVTGRLAVRALTLGRWRNAELRRNESRILGAAGALSFKVAGQRVVTETGQIVAGALFYVAVVAGVVLWVHSF
ncbi:hypothetical protein [Pseudorhodoferax sp.]|uniref:hypothetical protein n=1 Tax=Pseudorhodoferax sp. TaxID=1993553 RepID=UPI002DD66294|nr:hypothetical protein [Pseudorhodoferax sp.]